MTRIPRLAVLTLACLPAICRADTAEDLLAFTGVHGGLIVHVGCGDGQLTAALGARDGYLVHGLDVDRKKVAVARQCIKGQGLYGKVAVDTFSGRRLPYVDNLANLVISEDLGEVPNREVMRVLRPGGVAYVKFGDRWQKTVKPWPAQIDEWTHFLHGPDNNAVAHDAVVDVPRRMQWLGRPKFARAHEQLASLGACVTTAGRLFYVVDETPCADVRFPAQWALVARDAFNGVVLWRRPIPTWADQLRRFRSGPAGTAFRLVAVEDRVYVTLGVDAPVSILDAVSGKTLAVCEGTANARQVLRVDNKLLVLVDTRPQTSKEDDSQIRRGLKPAPGTRVIVAVDAAGGKALWRKEIDQFVHPTLAARGSRLFYQTNEHVVCVAVDTGDERWRAAMKLELSGHELGWESPTLVAYDAAVYSADFKQIVAYSLDAGEILWRAGSKQGYNSPPDVFLIDGLLWMRGKGMVAMDAATGEVKQEIPTVPGYMHHRCYRNKATDRFALLGIQGVQFVDLLSGDVAPNHWIRGTCQYGIMPANGLLYVTPDSCACNMKSKLAGFWALAPGAKGERGKGKVAQRLRQAESGGALRDARLERGPAYDDDSSPPSASNSPLSDVWPVYRHDAARSGMTRARVPAALRPAWRAQIGGRLSGVTAAAGKVFVASVDTHTVYALDERTGAVIWDFAAGGRVDSPPTIYGGKALFGSADGWVYALRASDGELAWRFRAAPQDRRTFVNGQLESVWPVHGSVLVHADKLLVAAGRSSYLDGGIRLYRLDPATGRRLSETVMYSPDPQTGKQPQDANRKDVRGVLSDVLLADAGEVYMRHVKLDFETGSHTDSAAHLFTPIGLLDDTWWHRGYWVFNDQFIAHWRGWWKVGNRVPSGRILSYDDRSIFGYGRDKYPGGNTGQWRGGEKYQLFACDRPVADMEEKPEAKGPAANRPARKGSNARQAAPAAVENRWATQVPFYVRAMVVAGETMFIAGPPELTTTQGPGEAALTLDDPRQALAAWNGKQGGLLWAVSTKDGKKLAEYELDAPPVFDGMAAAGGRLYLAAGDGSLICYAE